MVAFKKIVLGTALAASAITAAVPASAQTYYRGGDYRRDNGTSAAIGAGILGVIIGTVIGSATSRNNGYVSNGAYRNGQWYEGYRYHNGSFYDRQGRRVYDRNTWDQRRAGSTYGYNNRDYDQGQYQNGYNGTYNNGYNGTYNGGYDVGNGYYNGQTYNGQTYNGQTYNGQTYKGGGYYNRGY